MHPAYLASLDMAFAAAKAESNMRRGKENSARGEDTERKVLEAFEQSKDPTPLWFIRIDRASFPLDMDEGVDFVAQTDVGNLYFQAKSSERYVRQFLERQAAGDYNKYIAVAALPPGMAPEQICAAVIGALSPKRDELLALRGGFTSKRLLRSAV